MHNNSDVFRVADHENKLRFSINACSNIILKWMDRERRNFMNYVGFPTMYIVYILTKVCNTDIPFEQSRMLLISVMNTTSGIEL